MSKLSEEQKRIKKLHRSYSDARKQIREAMAKGNPGTAVHLQHVRALQEMDARERAEEVSLGLSPANLGAMVTTSFVYVAHVQQMPANAAELEKILGAQMVKACKELHYTPEDEAIREQLVQEFR